MSNDTILIVEDNPSMAKLAALAVGKANTGCNILFARDYKTAVNMLAQGNIAAVITDNNFPADSIGDEETNKGVDLVRHIRQKYEQLPVLLISSALSPRTLDALSAATGQAPGSAIYAPSGLITIDAHTEAAAKDKHTEGHIIDFLHRKLGRSGPHSALSTVPSRL